MSDDNLYNLKTGAEGEEQLDNLERACGENSHLFLNRVGLRAGINILDVGCGAGHMSCWIAKQIYPTGHVYAIDNNQKQLEVAENKARKNQISNISFHSANVYDLSEFAELADITYCRWLLFHLSDPKQACISMVKTIKNSGFLACEVGCAETNFFFPYYEAHDIVMSKISELMKSSNNDPYIGLNILKIFQSLNELNDIELSIAQNAWSKSSDIKLFLKGLITALDSASEALIKQNILSEAQIISLKKDISSHELLPGTLALSTRITQIFARKI